MNDTDRHTPPLRVLHIGKYFPPHPGGMETYLRDLMNVQKRQGLDVMALVHASQRGLFDTEESVDALDGTTYQLMRSARWFNVGFVPVSPGFIWSAFKVMKNFKPDLIHIHHPNSSAVWLLFLPAARKLPWVAHWHSDIVTPVSNFAVKAAYRLYHPWEGQILKQSSCIIATSPSYMAKSARLVAYLERCRCIPLGLDDQRLPAPTSVQLKSRPLAPLILFIGRLVTYKGLDDLVNAMLHLPDVHCWIGGGGELFNDLADLIHSSGLQNRMKLLGVVSESEKWELYRTCDALVLPSNQSTEAFGLVLLEAAYFRKPVVVTDTQGSGMSWVAKGIPGSATAKANNPESLARAISRVLAQAEGAGNTSIGSADKTLTLTDQCQQITEAYSESLRSQNSEGG